MPIDPMTAEGSKRDQLFKNADRTQLLLSCGVQPSMEAMHELSLAYITMKEVARERQEVIDWHNMAWRNEGYHGMVREAPLPKFDSEILKEYRAS